MHERRVTKRQDTRRRGRPPAQEPCTTLSTWIPNAHYDKLAEIARRHDVSMSTLVRRVIILRLHEL
jgi:hypothetical protein